AEHVHVNDGGQAVIGNVKTCDAPDSSVSLRRPRFTDVDELVPGEEPKRWPLVLDPGGAVLSKSAPFSAGSAAMARGDRIELRGFGSFGVKNGPRRMTLIQHAVATMGRTAPQG